MRGPALALQLFCRIHTEQEGGLRFEACGVELLVVTQSDSSGKSSPVQLTHIWEDTEWRKVKQMQQMQSEQKSSPSDWSSNSHLKRHSRKNQFDPIEKVQLIDYPTTNITREET